MNFDRQNRSQRIRNVRKPIAINELTNNGPFHHINV